MANSPTTVLPAPVGAATSTSRSACTASQACTWKSSSSTSNASRNWPHGVRASAWRRVNAAYRSAGEDIPPSLGLRREQPQRPRSQARPERQPTEQLTVGVDRWGTPSTEQRLQHHLPDRKSVV